MSPPEMGPSSGPEGIPCALSWLPHHSLKQGFSARSKFAPRNFATPGDVFGYHNWGVRVLLASGGERRTCPWPPTVHRTAPHKEWSRTKLSVVLRVRNPIFETDGLVCLFPDQISQPTLPSVHSVNIPQRTGNLKNQRDPEGVVAPAPVEMVSLCDLVLLRTVSERSRNPQGAHKGAWRLASMGF